ncbi:hypothetical protein ACHAWF_007531 [Thalassiosira exigua]
MAAPATAKAVPKAALQTALLSVAVRSLRRRRLGHVGPDRYPANRLDKWGRKTDGTQLPSNLLAPGGGRRPAPRASLVLGGANGKRTAARPPANGRVHGHGHNGHANGLGPSAMSQQRNAVAGRRNGLSSLANGLDPNGANGVIVQAEDEKPRPEGKYASDLVVVLDMDECLVHSQFLSDQLVDKYRQVEDRPSAPSNGTSEEAIMWSTCDSFRINLPDGDLVHVNKRPNLDLFLREVTSRFETYVFTAAMEVSERLPFSFRRVGQLARCFLRIVSSGAAIGEIPTTSVRSVKPRVWLSSALALTGGDVPCRMRCLSIERARMARSKTRNRTSKTRPLTLQTVPILRRRQVYAAPVLDKLDPHGDMFRARLYREHCVYDPDVGAYAKDLRDVMRLRRDLDEEADDENASPDEAGRDHPRDVERRVVLVDNNPLSFLPNPSNGILVSSFYDDPKDDTLEAVTELLHELDEGGGDVRPTLDERFGMRDALDDVVRGASSSRGCEDITLDENCPVPVNPTANATCRRSSLEDELNNNQGWCLRTPLAFADDRSTRQSVVLGSLFFTSSLTTRDSGLCKMHPNSQKVMQYK